MRTLIIFELTEAHGNDLMVGDLIRALKKQGSSAAHMHGLFTRVTNGGMHPKRIINLLYMLFLLPFVLLYCRNFDRVVIRSTPPLLHLCAAVICKCFKLPCFFWLMDYHPVIEQRLWGQRTWLRPVFNVLDGWDRKVLGYFEQVVVLDQAMSDLVSERNPQARVVIHPTWFEGRSSPALQRFSASAQASSLITLAYVGNFGRGHLWGLMSDLIKRLSSRVQVRMIGVNLSESSQVKFQALSQFASVEVVLLERLPFDELIDLFRVEKVNFGCVAMLDSLKGCLSPSKFSSYVEAELPVLYFGPEKTNAWQVCAEFGGGLYLTEGAGASDLDALVSRMIDPSLTEALRDGVKQAKQHFRGFNGETLANQILQPIV